VTREVRELARADMRAFIKEHLESQRPFVFETTLRDVTFEQVREATARGFESSSLLSRPAALKNILLA
jgi:predicted ABC-type ATPase